MSENVGAAGKGGVKQHRRRGLHNTVDMLSQFDDQRMFPFKFDFFVFDAFQQIF
ncbi:hypothetical protein J1782_01810 [Rahnella sp. BCC 1045]|uniref:hypothetical protein n=1 Tax=Rahnella sp. BCC 1045 TaxID=2816251 RepID=UPI001C259C9F|nr:hypothetical protein [Rahnella sp. BCC 1045]MBU9818625.1 hypothetical protein [Rahnella sp. BCC 1045]